MHRSILDKLFRTGRKVSRRERRAKARQHARRLQLEALEQRALLAANVFANDNWFLVADNDNSMSVTAGDTVRNDNDTIATGTITAMLGVDAVGTVTTGAFIGTAAGFVTINDGVALTDPGGTLNVLEGMYQDNVILNKQVNLLGAQAGVDARGRMAAESIITTAAAAGTGILIELQSGSAGSVIDGFTFGDSGRGVESSSGPIDNLELLNNRFVGATSAAVFLNDSGVDITVDQNVFDGTTKTAAGGLFHLDQDNFDGFHFTNNWVVNDQAIGGTGFFVDGNHNLGASVGRAPLIQGNLVQNNNTGMNLGSRAFEFGSIVENTFDDNIFDGLQGGIQNSSISRNTFSNNGRWGLALTSFGNLGADRGAQNSTINENFFSANTMGDVLFSSTQAPGTISTNTLFGNSLTSATAVSYDGTETIDASGNWWGTNDEVAVRAKITGAGAANVDSTPFLDTGTDTDGGTPGFQGDFSTLHVTALGAQTGPLGRIQEGIDLVDAGGTVIVGDGTYMESPNINKSLTLESAGGRATTFIELQTGPTYLGSLTIGGQDVTVDGFTIVGRDAVGMGLASTNILVNTGLNDIRVLNNRLRVGQIGAGSNGDDGMGLLTTFTTTPAMFVQSLEVTGNIFEPLAGSASRAFFINPGVTNFTFQDNEITGQFNSLSLTQASNGLVHNNVVTGTGSSAGIGSWGSPDPDLFGQTTFSANTITQTATAISVIDTNHVDIQNNSLHANTTGVWVRSFDPMLAGGLDASTVVMFDNSITGYTTAVLNTYPMGAGAADASGNWWGTIDDAVIEASMTGLVDFTPYLASGTDSDGGTPGFQGDFGTLHVTALGAQTGLVGRIQEGIDLVDAGGTVHVNAGLYTESVVVNKAVDLLGAQAGVDPSTRTAGGAMESILETAGTRAVSVAASGVTIDGFDIVDNGAGGMGIAETTPVVGTTIANNFIHGFSALGVAYAAGSSGGLVELNEIYENYAGAYFSTGANNIVVQRNLIRDHVDGALDQGSGVVLEGNNTDIAVQENFLENNAQGVYVWTGFGVDFTGTQVFNNSLIGNTTQVENTNASALDASGNWWGTIDDAVIEASMSGLVDFTPYLASGADSDAGTPGFQGDFSTLYVTSRGEQVQAGGRINEAIGLVTASEVIVNDGIYNEDVLVDIDDLNLHSAGGAAVTTINGQSTGFTGAVRTIAGVSNFTFGGAGVGFTVNGAGQAGVYLGSGNDGHVIEDNIINAATGNNALLTEGGQSNHTIQDNTFGNVAGSASQLVYVNGNASVAVASVNVDFLDNLFTGSATGPLLGQEADSSLIQGNSFTGATTYAAIEIWGDSVIVDDNTLSGTGTGAGLLVQNTANTFTLSDSSITGYATGGSITGVATVHWDTTDQGDDVLVDGQNSQFSATGDKVVQAIDFSGVTTLNVNTLDGEDTVTVSPHATTVINLDGGDPAVPPGDTLILVTPPGETATSTPDTPLPGQTTISTTGGFADVIHQNFEEVVFGGDLVINGTGGDDVLTVFATGTDSGTYMLTSNGVLIEAGSLMGVTSLTFNGLDGHDILRIHNPGGGLFAPIGGVDYNGGPNTTVPVTNPFGDSLEILGGAAASVEHEFTNDNDGFVYYNGAGTATITYTGLEPITDTIMAGDRTFTFTGGAETITLSDDGVVANGQSQIDSSLGESVVFTNPTGTLTIDVTLTAGADAIHLEGLDSLFNANLTVTAGGDDTVTAQTNPTSLGAGNLSVTAGSITLNANISTTGNADLTALTGNITDDADNDVANLTANMVTLSLDASPRSIGVSTADRFEIDAVLLDVNTVGAGNDAFLRDTAGGLQVTDSSLGGGGSVFDILVLNGNLTSVVGGPGDVRADFVVVEVTGAASTIGAASPLEINANNRFDATSAGGNIRVRDVASGFPVGTVNANGGDVFLTTTVGPITDANGAATNVTGDDLTASATTGINLDTNVNTIVATTTGTGAIALDEFDGVTLTSVTSNSGNVTITAGGTTNAVNVTSGGSGDASITTSAGDINVTSVTAAGDRVTLDAGGSILDASGAVTNITALEAVLTAGGGIGSVMGNGALDTAVSFLEAEALGGGVWIDNSGSLTIGGITGLVGVSATGVIEISTAGPLDVTEHVISTGGSVILTTVDSLASDGLIIRTLVIVRSDLADVNLRAGDNLTLEDSSTVSAPLGQVNLFGDFGNADPGVGSTISLLGTIISGTQATVTGDADDDTIILDPGMGHMADSILLNGTGGNDTYFVQFGALNGPVDIDDSGAGDNDSATVSGTAAPEDFTVNNNADNGDPQTGGFVTNNTLGETVNYTQSLEHLTVEGQDGNDTLHVQPSQTAEITINGGNPVFGDPGVPPGDTLDFDPLDNTFVIDGKTILTNGGNPDPFMGVNFISIENLPLDPLGVDTQRYDMDFIGGSTATAPGFTSVPQTRVYGGGTSGSDFGWDVAVGGFGTTITDPLLKDGHFGTTARTFSTDITDGWYLVSVSIGVSTSKFDNVQVAAEGTVVLTGLDTPEFQFIHRSFVVQVTNGTLDLEFSDLDGVMPTWGVNGIEIRPAVLLTLGIIPPAGPLLASSAPVIDTFQGVNATPNTQITVSTTFGTITSADVNPLLAGVQVMSDVMGLYSFDVQRPATGGEALVRAEEVTGQQTGCVIVEYLTPPEHHFDFNSGTSPTAAGYIGVGDTNAFNPALGYGWQATASTVVRTNGGPLLRDGHFGTDNTFTVNVNNGAYTVNVTIGDNLTAVTNIDVFAEGVLELDNVSTAAGSHVHRSFQVTVSDGQLDIRLFSDGGTSFLINALDIIESPSLIAIVGPAGPLTADGATIDTYSGSGAGANALVTVSTTLGTIVSPDADPFYAGVQIMTDLAGAFSVDVLRPFVAGTATITAEEVNAASFGTAMQDYEQGAALRFDLNSTGTPTAAGFVGLGTTNLYNAMQGYGWLATAPTYSTAGPNALLRDFHYGMAPNTFLVDLPNGDYVVNVTLGYDLSGFDGVNVAAEGLPAQLTGLGSTAGRFIHRSFTVTVGDGQLNLQFSDTAGSAFFPVNAIELLQVPVGTLTLLGTTMEEADGMSVDLYTGSGATPNSLITISTTLGTPTGPDASTAYAGLQVMSDGAGAFSFSILRPSLAGSATIAAEEVSAATIGTLGVTYTASTTQRFDFNHFGTPTAPGFTGVGTTNAFNPGLGYGWLTNAPSASIAIADPLLQDLQYGLSNNTFRVSVEMGATYLVTAHFRYIISSSGFDINPEGGATVDEVSVPANTNVALMFTATDVNNDGLLDIQFATDGSPYFIVNGLEFVRQPLMAAVAPAENPTTELLAADDLAPIVAEAIARWATVSPDAAETLSAVDVRIENLPGGDLGLASGHTIVIDADAAGYGWFVDATPGDDAEFDGFGQAIASDAAGRFDLLTLVMHELGHVLGLDDLDADVAGDNLMAALLPLGARRSPQPLTSAAIDDAFASGESWRNDSSESIGSESIAGESSADRLAAYHAVFSSEGQAATGRFGRRTRHAAE
jgi:fibronectin type 3 domain-containing protein